MGNWNNKRKACPGHGFWIVADDFLDIKTHPMYCSACGRPNSMPAGDFCRWCGTRMDQELLDLSEPHIINESNISD